VKGCVAGLDCQTLLRIHMLPELTNPFTPIYHRKGV
jgi:hypothetical protein